MKEMKRMERELLIDKSVAENTRKQSIEKSLLESSLKFQKDSLIRAERRNTIADVDAFNSRNKPQIKLPTINPKVKQNLQFSLSPDTLQRINRKVSSKARRHEESLESSREDRSYDKSESQVVPD